MGQIRIWAAGSFGMYDQTFSDQDHGHADAVERAAAYLTETLLPRAIAKDVRLAQQGHYPNKGFGPTIQRATHSAVKDAQAILKDAKEATDGET